MKFRHLTPEEAREQFETARDLLYVRVRLIIWGLGLYLRLWK